MDPDLVAKEEENRQSDVEEERIAAMVAQS
jgi:hypothetical protein